MYRILISASAIRLGLRSVAWFRHEGDKKATRVEIRDHIMHFSPAVKVREEMDEIAE